jgi:hypothetical protein
MPESGPLLGEGGLGCENVGEEVALVGVFEDEYVVRSGLLILLITREGNTLAVLEGPHDVGVVQALQHQELVQQVSLLLGTARGHYLQDHPALPRTVSVDLRLVALR